MLTLNSAALLSSVSYSDCFLSLQEDGRARPRKEMEPTHKQKDVGLPVEMTTSEDRGSVDSASKERDPTECEPAAVELEEQGVNLSPNSRKRKSPDEPGVNLSHNSKQRKSPSKRTKRKNRQRQREKNSAADFRSTMTMGQTYNGVVRFIPPPKPEPGTIRARIQVEQTPLMGFADITASTVALNQPVKVRMTQPDPEIPTAALQLELV